MSAPKLFIPGPTEFDPEVLASMSMKGTSHVDPSFIETFGRAIEQTREVFLAPDGQPFILAGSGSLGWDLVASNLLSDGDNVVVVSQGYFGESWAECFEIYGANVKVVSCGPGDIPAIADIEEAVRSFNPKLVSITHVDTSTGVRADIKSIAAAVHAVNNSIMVAVDGVCAVGGEEVRLTEWDIDAYITGSQKALGVPPGLSVSVFRARAMEEVNRRVENGVKPKSYYANAGKWLNIMKAYEKRTPSYYATPAVPLVVTLQVAYDKLLANGGMEARFAEHKAAAEKVRAHLSSLGLSLVATSPELAANTMSAVKFPEMSCAPGDFLAAAKKAGAVFAGGLHKDIKATYFRVGHMGYSTRTDEHIQSILSAITAAVNTCSSKL